MQTDTKPRPNITNKTTFAAATLTLFTGDQQKLGRATEKIPGKASGSSWVVRTNGTTVRADTALARRAALQSTTARLLTTPCVGFLS